MTKPTSYLIRMILFCLIVYGGVAAISLQLARFYMANPVINTVIILVEIFGVPHFRCGTRIHHRSRKPY